MDKITYRLPNDGKRHRFAQNYDRTKIFVTKAGKRYNCYDAIQAANVDTDIYNTLEKYGSIEPMYRKNVEEIQQEFTEFMSLRDIQEQHIKANQMWENLSPGVREEFKNDIFNFMQNGEKWLKDQIDTFNKQNEENVLNTKKSDAKIIADALKQGDK